MSRIDAPDYAVAIIVCAYAYALSAIYYDTDVSYQNNKYSSTFQPLPQEVLSPTTDRAVLSAEGHCESRDAASAERARAQ